jgi:hypothetical protein
MSSQKLRRTAIAVFTLLVVGGTSVSATGASGHEGRLLSDPTPRVTSTEAEPGIAPPDSDKTAVYLDKAGRVMDMSQGAGVTPKAGGFRCTPVSGRDNPHVSENKIDMSAWVVEEG